MNPDDGGESEVLALSPGLGTASCTCTSVCAVAPVTGLGWVRAAVEVVEASPVAGTASFACFFETLGCFGSADLDVEGVFDDELTALDGGAPAFDCCIGFSRSCFCCTLAERRLFCAGSSGSASFSAFDCDAAADAAAGVFEEAGVARPRFFAGIAPALLSLGQECMGIWTLGGVIITMPVRLLFTDACVSIASINC